MAGLAEGVPVGLADAVGAVLGMTILLALLVELTLPPNFEIDVPKAVEFYVDSHGDGVLASP